MYIIGQIFGVLSAAICAVAPLFKFKWQMLTLTLFANIFTAVNFILIGQLGATVVLCTVACIQTVVSMIYLQQGKVSSHKQQLLFFCIYLFAGLWGLVSAPGFTPQVNWQNTIELMPICGALMSMAYVFVPDEQKARRFLLLSSIIWLVYMLLVHSTAFLAQLISIVTTSSALLHYRKSQRNSQRTDNS